MKKISLIFSLLVLFACHNTSTRAQENTKTLIGNIENGTPVFSADKQRMMSTYSANLLKQSGIDANFNEMSIILTSENEYLLLFKGSFYRSAFAIMRENNLLYAVSNIACTTSDCAAEEFGCTPRISGVSCRPCSNKGKCTKTVTSFSLID